MTKASQVRRPLAGTAVRSTEFHRLPTRSRRIFTVITIATKHGKTKTVALKLLAPLAVVISLFLSLVTRVKNDTSVTGRASPIGCMKIGRGTQILLGMAVILLSNAQTAETVFLGLLGR